MLDYIDYGEKANKFLMHCGVLSEPSPNALAENIINNYKRFIGSAGPKKYAEILRRLAHNLHSIDEQYLKKLKTTPFLIVYKDLEERSWQALQLYSFAYLIQLGIASDCYIIDNMKYQKVIHLV